MTTDVAATAKPGSARELLQIALPLVLSLGSLTLMLVVDRIFLTWYSDKALAACMPAGMMQWTLLSLFIGTANYLNSFVAQYEGAKQPERVAAVLWQGIHFSLAAGLLVTLCAPFAGPLFAWAGHEPEVAQMEASYFSILCLGSIPVLLSCSLSSFYSGRGETLVIMWVNLAGSLINMGLAYLFIFPCQLGIEGAGAATVTAEVATCAIFIALIAKSPVARLYGLAKAWRFDRELFSRLLRYGIPNGCQLLIDGFCYTLFILMVGMIKDPGSPQDPEQSTRLLAATNLAFNLNTLAFLPMLGFSTAVATIVGNRIGEGRPELGVRSTWTAFWISGLYMLGFGMVYVLVPDLILLPYKVGSDPGSFAAIRPIAVLLLRFVAVYSLFDTMAIVFGAAIRGAGDTRFAMLFALLCGVFLMVLPTYVGCRYLQGGIFLAWTTCTLNICAVGIGFFIRFQQGRWKTLRIIEETFAPSTQPPQERDSSAGLKLEV